MEYFGEAAVLGVPLLFVVIGVVEWIKKLGLTGKVLLVVSMVVGILFGAGYQASVLGFPVDFAGWFGLIFYGIGLGLVASGVYDANKNR